MPRGINKAIIIGTLGRDPQVGYTPSGATVVNMSLATNETWKDKNTGQQQDRTEWHRIVIFGKLAEIAAQYLKKGAQCYIEGRIQTRKWQGSDGQDRYTTEIIANELEMLGARGASDMQTGSQPPPGGHARPQPSQPPAAGPSSVPTDDDGSDDIPF